MTRHILHMLAELTHDCASGTARRRLEQRYDIPANTKGWEAITTAPLRSDVAPENYVCFRKKKLSLLPPAPTDRKEKTSARRVRERLEKEKIDAQRERRRLARQEELRQIIEVQRREKERRLAEGGGEDEQKEPKKTPVKKRSVKPR